MAKRRQRGLGAVPRPIIGLLGIALAAQLCWAGLRAGPVIDVRALPKPPSLAMLRITALGENDVLARLLMLWLQGFDYQPGVSLAFRDLDYARVEDWLDRILALDETFQYPLLAAVRVYGDVDDAARQRRMLDFVRRHFHADRAHRWPWMAHAVYIARHRLHDDKLALALANDLAQTPADASIPSWVRQMRIFALADMGDLESARVLLGGLLESGEVSDPHERHFLTERLRELEQDKAAVAP